MDIGEAVNVLIMKGYKDDGCPFCGKDPHDFGSGDKMTTKTKVVSKPKQLNCTMSGSGADRRGASECSGMQLPYTIARHHLISAKQCYALVKPLVRQASSAGYDINDPHNGIGLPTTHFSIKYASGAAQKKYGDLLDWEKSIVANSIMGELGAQWHVGHHSFEYIPFESQKGSPADQNWGDEIDGVDTEGHPTGYDSQVIDLILDVMEQLFNPAEPWCEDEDDPSDDIQQKMKDVSAKIKADLEKFQSGRPWESKLFVSMKAHEFADRELQASNATSDGDGNPPTKKQKLS